MKDIFLKISIVTLLCILSYQLGSNRCKVVQITKEKEILKNEKNCANNLLANPNLIDDAIIKLLDSGKL